tara:strand:- start:141908 stop:142966 length:1059 start_codon:yes stop_codon:yes gene_type:complete
VAENAPQEAYVRAILTDLDNQINLTGDRNISSIFFGGGTPSLMKPAYIETILNKISQLYTVSEATEITIEANPTSSELSKFQDFKAAGINRLSVGVQSFNKDDLAFLGREHNDKEARETVEHALKTFNNVSFDMIFGLPNQSLDSWSEQLKYAINIGTQHLSAYQLTIEQNTVFYAQVKKNKWQPMHDDLQADFYELTRETLTSHNYKHYEISNFAKDGYMCMHNYNIWQYGDYIGVGAGAHGRLQTTENKRITTQNYKMPNKYIESVEHVEHGFFVNEPISDTTARQEMILMGLRTQKGVSKHLLDGNFTSRQALEELLLLGMLYEYRGNIALTDSGQLLLDSILERLILD